jgi:two-component sensor histidine kinase
VALNNYLTHVLLRSVPLLTALSKENVVAVLILGGFFFATGLADSHRLRMLQAVAFGAGGLISAALATTDYMPSAVFIIFALMLLGEYGTRRANRIVVIVFCTVYIVAILYDLVTTASRATEDPTTSPPVVVLYSINTITFTGIVIFLYGFVIYRQRAVLRHYSEQLEERVAERTQELESAVRQRDELLRELHHRVGNSLQLLSSYISLQLERIPEDQREPLRETEVRVHAIAGVHATLNQANRLSRLPFRSYLEDLVSDLNAAYANSVRVVADALVDLDVALDFATPFGLVLNELVTNAARVGAENSARVTVRIAVALLDTNLNLLVRIEGAGSSVKRRLILTSGIVDQLVAQMGGHVRHSEEREEAVFSLPLNDVTSTETRHKT